MIGYQLPMWRVESKAFICVGAWKEHFSIYAANAALMTAFKGKLDRYLDGRATLKFPFSEPVPERLIARVAQVQAKDAARRLKERAARRKSRR